MSAKIIDMQGKPLQEGQKPSGFAEWYEKYTTPTNRQLFERLAQLEADIKVIAETLIQYSEAGIELLGKAEALEKRIEKLEKRRFWEVWK
jgi:hypothetical protein